MKGLFVLFFLLFFSSCVEQIEPIDESAEPVKINSLVEALIEDGRAQIDLEVSDRAIVHFEYGKTSNLDEEVLRSTNLVSRHMISLKNLQADTIYYYRATVIDKNLNRVQSKIKTFRTLKKKQEDPVDIRLSINGVHSRQTSHFSTQILWETSQVTTGQVEFKEEGESLFSLSSKKELTLKKNHLHILNNLKENTVYTFRVKSDRGDGQSITSSVYRFKTSFKPLIDFPPVLSVSKVSEITKNGALITWKADQLTKGVIKYGEGKDLKHSVSIDKYSLSHQKVLSRLKENTKYYFKIQLIAKNGKTTTSEVIDFMTKKEKVIITSATSLSVTLLDGRYLLKWSFPSSIKDRPEGGYDIWINGKDGNEHLDNKIMSKTLSGLDLTKKNCFKLESRWIQASPQRFLPSEEVCVDPIDSDLNDLVNDKKSLTLKNFRVKDGDKSRLYFDSTKPIEASTIKGFRVSGKTVTKIVTNSDKKTDHYFIVKEPFTYWDNNTIEYKGGSDLKDTSLGHTLLPFTMEYVYNHIKEPIGRGKTYYVSVSGSNSNSGLSESRAWRTIGKAFKMALAGDTVYIKAGNYGKEKIAITRGGTRGAPIRFIGYKKTPGDIVKNYYDYKKSISSSEMPTLNGGSRSSGGYAIKAWSKSIGYVFIENLQVQNYEYGFHLVSVHHLVLRNVNVVDIGGDDSYSLGIQFISSLKNKRKDNRGNPIADHPSTYNKIIGNVVKNATGNGISFHGGFNLASGNRVYCDRGYKSTTPALDYYLNFRGSHNIEIDNIAHRANGIAHGGYAVGPRTAKKDGYNVLSEYNLMIKNKSIGIDRPLKARNYGANYNVFKYNYIVGYGALKDNKNGGISIFGGARHNVWEKNVFKNTSKMVEFYNNRESQADDKISEGNIIRNNVFNGTWEFIQVANVDINKRRHTIRNNKIYNNTIYDVKMSLFRDYSGSVNIYQGNQFTNNIISKIKYKFENSISKTPFTKAFSFSHNNFYQVPFRKFPGHSNLSSDPRFVNAAGGNFELKESSPVIDAGKRFEGVFTDFNGVARPQGRGVDMGAFEYAAQK